MTLSLRAPKGRSRLGAIAVSLAAVLATSTLSAAPASAEEVPVETTADLSGTFFDEDGKVPFYAYIQVFKGDDQQSVASAQVDNTTGQWQILDLEPGTYRASAMTMMMMGGTEWYDGGFNRATATPIELAAGDVRVIEIVSKYPGLVYGNVTASGKSLKQVKVTAHLPFEPFTEVGIAYTGYSGDYSLNIRPGEYKLHFAPTDSNDPQWLGGFANAAASDSVFVERASNTNAGTTNVGESYTSTGTVTVTGAPAVGKTLMVSAAGWVPTPSLLTFQWFRNGSPITMPSYTGSRKITAADAGQELTVIATPTLSGFQSTTSSAVVSVQSMLTATPVPVISGTSRVGFKLTAKAGTWSPAPVALSYQWTRDGKAISRATSSTYTLTRYDRDHSIRVVVTGSKSGYTSIAKTSARRSIS